MSSFQSTENQPLLYPRRRSTSVSFSSKSLAESSPPVCRTRGKNLWAAAVVAPGTATAPTTGPTPATSWLVLLLLLLVHLLCAAAAVVVVVVVVPLPPLLLSLPHARDRCRLMTCGGRYYICADPEVGIPIPGARQDQPSGGGGAAAMSAGERVASDDQL